MNSTLAVGIGGSHVKIRIPSDPGKTPCDSGSAITPRQVVDGVPVHGEGRSRYEAASLPVWCARCPFGARRWVFSYQILDGSRFSSFPSSDLRQQTGRLQGCS